MNKHLAILSAAALLGSTSAWAENDRATQPDLTYCLQLKSSADIARCAGETTTSAKGQPMTRDEVERLLEQQGAAAPASTGEAAAPAAAEPQIVPQAVPKAVP